MEAPLLERSLEVIGESGDYVRARGVRLWWRIFCIESLKLWGIGGPIAFQIMCQFGTNSVATIFVGHLGDLQLSAFSIALSVVANFAFGFLLGMGSALETLCGQAFGAGQVHMLGVYMQRSIIILFASCILLLPLYIYATPILKLLGQPDEIAKPAGFFTLLVIPQMVAMSVIFPTQKFLQAQSKVGVLAWIAAISLLGHVLWCWLFINVFGWGAAGAAVAFDLSTWITAVAQFAYVVGFCKDGWKGFSWLAFRDIWAFVRLSLASAVMLCLEIWYMMSIIVMAGDLDDAVTAVGALSICMNVDGLECMLFIGVNAAIRGVLGLLLAPSVYVIAEAFVRVCVISVRVSNELGLGRPRAAKYSVYVTLFQSLVIGIVCMVAILATRNYFAVMFTDSPTMQRAVSRLSGLLGVTVLLNSIQPVISGVAIGGGWQGVVAYVNLACYYLIGLPLGYVLGYLADYGVVGIWGGMITGVALQTLVLIILIYRTNWNKEVEQASERMRKWGGQDIFINKPSLDHL